MTKFIINCDPENLILAARAAEKLWERKMASYPNPVGFPRYEFDNGVVMDGHMTDGGAFVIRQCEGG